MSVNRENVVWPAADGTWSIGFYEFHGSPSSEGWDYEWDVEYDFTRFTWCSVGHPTQNAARSAWDGANPGGATVITQRTAANEKECAQLDRMAAECLKTQYRPTPVRFWRPEVR